MSSRQTNKPEPSSRARRAPAMSAEGREMRIASAAMDLAERQIQEGTVSSQVQVHFLKLATEEARLQRVKLEHEIMMQQKKAEEMDRMAGQSVDYQEVVKMLTIYQGKDPTELHGD